MGSYRPPQHGYGPPPGQDPYARPGSTTYGQPQAGAHGYGSPVVNAPPAWNAPHNQQYASSQYAPQQPPLPPPPASAPPTNPSPYGYQIQTVGGQTVQPLVPPRIPQPYNQSTSTPPVPSAQSYQPPHDTTNAQAHGHSRVPSIPPAYHQEVTQNSQAWPQHPQYSTQPTTHNYDPPRLPLRPGTAPRPDGNFGHQQAAYGQVAPPPPPPQAAQYPGATPYQQPPQSQNYAPSPQSGSVYSPEENHSHHHHNQHSTDSYQTPGGYVPPPPPPKPHGYVPAQVYPPSEQQPPRPASISQPYGHQYKQPPPPPQNATYPGQPQPPAAQYGQEHGAPYQQYGAQPPNASAPYSQPPPRRQSTEYGSQYGHGRQTPSQSSSRPGSKPQTAHGYGRPPSRGDEQAPVSPLQSRQSISFERPSSTTNATAGAPETPALRPPKSAFTFSSDWEHFGSGADEIDDTAMYGVKKDSEEPETKMASVELPASSPLHGRANSEISAPESFHPSPAIAPATQHSTSHSQYTPTPPTGYPTPQPSQQPPVVREPSAEEADYIPPMPDTPPAATRPARSSIVIGGSSQTQAPPPAAPAFVMDSSTYQMQQPTQDASHSATQPSVKPPTPQPQIQSVAAHPPSLFAPYGQNVPATSWDASRTAAASDPAAALPQKPGVDAAQFRKVQQEAEDYKAELSHLQQELLNIRSGITEKDSLLAQRDGVIMQKDAAITQRDEEIAQRTTHLNDLQTSLAEITETFNAFKSSTSGLEAQVRAAEASQAELKTKVEQAEAAKGDLSTRLEKSGVALSALGTKHDGEKKELENKVKDLETKLETSSKEITELKKQLEEEKTKATTKAAEPVDIAPGLEAWFKGSLERCKEMLFTEQKPIPVQEKLKVFMDFVNAEAKLRGIDMPFGPNGEVKGFSVPHPQAQAKAAAKPERPRVTPPKESDGFVMVDSEGDMRFSPGGRPILNAPPADEYSPGGRPILRQPRTVPTQAAGPSNPGKAPTIPVPQENVQKPAYQPFRMDAPGSNPSSKGPSPVPVASAQPAKPAYQPFSAIASGSNPTPHSQGPVYKPLYRPNPAVGSTPLVETPKKMDDHDVFFDPVPGGRPRNRNDSIKTPQDQTMLPMPLKPRTPAPPVSTAADATQPTELPVANSPKVERQRSVPSASSVDRLRALVEGDFPAKPTQRLHDLTAALDVVQQDYSFTKTIAKSWEDKAAVTRSRLAKERAQRQADIERRNNELFDNGEIGYGDLETLESEAKEDELRSKADEDSAEYEDFSNDVFDAIYKRCHEDIGALVKAQTEIEHVLRNSSAGRNVISSKEGNSLSQGLQLLLKVHDKLELAHTEVTKAIQERDRRYKLTQTKPLYAAGDIAGMKRVEKACEESEKKAEIRARVERAERCKRLHRIVDAEMERGAGENEDFSADVIAAAEDVVSSWRDENKTELLGLVEQASKAIELVYEDTQALMKAFSQVDTDLNDCEYEVSVASAKHKGDPKEYFERLEVEKKREDGKLKDDAEKRSGAVREHQREAEAQLKAILAKANESADEREARERKEKALEDARRRNGAV